MPSAQRIYSGKVMIFGEYSVLEGSWSLLKPFSRVGGYFTLLDSSSSASSVESNRRIRSLAKYISNFASTAVTTLAIDVEALNQDLDAGLYFKSDIPEKYGLGSSGALCAALVDNYKTEGLSLSLSELRSLFSSMESFFHGTSSGLDPLPVYFNKEIALMNNEIEIYNVENTGKNLHVFLIDSGIKSQTAPLVSLFRKKISNSRFRNNFIKKYIPEVNEAVVQWCKGSLNIESTRKISEQQSVLFNEMIPEKLTNIWKFGLDSGLYALKLCGSGGGGMTLGFTSDWTGTEKKLSENGYRPISI